MVPAFSRTSPNSNQLTPLFTPKLFSRKASTQITRMLINNQQASSTNWSLLSSEINTHILKSLPTTPPPSVTVPIRHLLSAAPPSIAPALCLAACELVGGKKHLAMNTACAIQLMHSVAHTRTQLILRQEALEENNMSTSSSCSKNLLSDVMRPGIALMTGDGIMALGYEMVARSEGGGDNNERIVRVVTEMARVMGAQGLVEGQMMEAEGRVEMEWWWERKGGRLSACAAACGAILGGGREEDVEKLRRFGLYVGMVNEMMMRRKKSEDINIRSYEEVIEVFRSLARLELQGFGEQERVDDLLELLIGLGCNKGKEKRKVTTPLSSLCNTTGDHQ